MWEADLAKKKIEQEQRVRERTREAAGLEYKGIYFQHEKQDDGEMLWVFNNKYCINPEYLEKLRQAVVTERNEAKRLQEEETKFLEEIRWKVFKPREKVVVQ